MCKKSQRPASFYTSIIIHNSSPFFRLTLDVSRFT
jgi:hypothetical protein